MNTVMGEIIRMIEILLFSCKRPVEIKVNIEYTNNMSNKHTQRVYCTI